MATLSLKGEFDERAKEEALNRGSEVDKLKVAVENAEEAVELQQSHVSELRDAYDNARGQAKAKAKVAMEEGEVQLDAASRELDIANDALLRATDG